MAVARKYERDIDLVLAEEFAVSLNFSSWFLGHTKKFSSRLSKVVDVYVSRTDLTGESDLVVVFESESGESRFALHIEDKIDAPFQPDQAARYRRRAANELARGDYSDYESILCSPQSYWNVHKEDANLFDTFVSYEEIAKFLISDNGDDQRAVYRSNFFATAASHNANTWTRVDDNITNAFWSAAYDLASRRFPELEMKELTLTKDSTWATFRPVNMPTKPKWVYVSCKGDQGHMDLTFNGGLARVFQPKVAGLLEGAMTVHQTGRSAAIRIVVDPFQVSAPNSEAMLKVEKALAACARLIRFYFEHREALDSAFAESLSLD